jgi:transposase-like protein
LTTRQIQDHLKDIYAVDVSPELISRATDEAKELAVKKSVYLALAIRLDGPKKAFDTVD